MPDYLSLVEADSPVAFYSCDFSSTNPHGSTSVSDSLGLPGSNGTLFFATLAPTFMGGGDFVECIYGAGNTRPLLSASAPLPALSACSYNCWIDCVPPTSFSNFWQLTISPINQTLFQNGARNNLTFNGIGTSFNLADSPGVHMLTVVLQAPASSSATTTTALLYIDAVLVATITNAPVVGTTITSSTPSSLNEPTSSFAFYVAACSMHSIALSPAQIYALYTAGATLGARPTFAAGARVVVHALPQSFGAGAAVRVVRVPFGAGADIKAFASPMYLAAGARILASSVGHTFGAGSIIAKSPTIPFGANATIRSAIVTQSFGAGAVTTIPAPAPHLVVSLGAGDVGGQPLIPQPNVRRHPIHGG